MSGFPHPDDDDEAEIRFDAPPKRPFKVGTATTVDVQTGEVVEERRNAMTMLPCGPGVCQTCAVDHPHDQPHNPQSMYFQMQFHAMHGRWPGWTDAMAHSPDAVRLAWMRELMRRGVVEPGWREALGLGPGEEAGDVAG